MRISNKKLEEEILLKIYRLFFEVISKYEDQDSFFEILEDILYPTEKIMVAKRVAIIFLLMKGIGQEMIAETLKVSTGTVSKYNQFFYEKESRLVNLLKSMIKKEKTLDFLEGVFSDLLIQPGIRKGHWQLYWDNKKVKDRKKLTGL